MATTFDDLMREFNERMHGIIKKAPIEIDLAQVVSDIFAKMSRQISVKTDVVITAAEQARNRYLWADTILAIEQHLAMTLLTWKSMQLMAEISSFGRRHDPRVLPPNLDPDQRIYGPFIRSIGRLSEKAKRIRQSLEQLGDVPSGTMKGELSLFQFRLGLLNFGVRNIPEPGEPRFSDLNQVFYWCEAWVLLSRIQISARELVAVYARDFSLSATLAAWVLQYSGERLRSAARIRKWSDVYYAGAADYALIIEHYERVFGEMRHLPRL